MFIYNLSFSNCSFLATHTQSKSKHQQAYYFTDQHFHLDSEKVHAKNNDENCIGKCIKFNLIVVLVTLCWLNKVLKNSDQRSCHGFHTFRDVGSGGAGGRTPPPLDFPLKNENFGFCLMSKNGFGHTLPHITTRPPRFSDLPASLHMRKRKLSNQDILLLFIIIQKVDVTLQIYLFQ